MSYGILDWDSEFFGMVVASITAPALTEHELEEVLSELKILGADLVYWPSPRRLPAALLEQFRGILADVKITFAMDLGTLGSQDSASLEDLESLAGTPSNEALEDLAIQSGEYSRFALDPRIPRERFEALYRLWIRRSLSKEIADEVLGIRVGADVVGLTTLGNRTGRGDIGLLAVHKDHRGRHYGEKLVLAAQRWFAAHGFDVAQVVTQSVNIPACRLYEKCGYTAEKSEFFYHFWPRSDG